jgi:hypothetical protein
MLMLPPSYRRSGRLPREIIAREWPALLEWPINQPIGASRLLFRAKKAFRKAAKVWREPESALRKLRGINPGSAR